MIKAGIMSMQRIANYGSFLQAYGLKSILQELGCEVEFVDYHPGPTLLPAAGGTGVKRKVSKALEVFAYRTSLRKKLSFIQYKKNYAKNYYPYLGIGETMNYAPELDLLVIGSDEVFNCVQDNTNVGFSSDLFGQDHRAARLISYAASFGNTTKEKLENYQVCDEVGSWLKDFHALSVRDQNSGQLVEAISGQTPIYHLDPVLAYDYMGKCKEIPETVPDQDYMILYGYSGRFTREECRYIRTYAKKKGLKIYCIGGIQDACDEFIDRDPFEVIAYFKQAKCVITDTFHGTILSTITHRPFVALVREQGYGNAEKLNDLLGRLGLTNRKVGDYHEIAKRLAEAIDYDAVDSILTEERKRSYAYLQEQIEFCQTKTVAEGFSEEDSPSGQERLLTEDGYPLLFAKKEDCAACGACLNVCPKEAISMVEDAAGFLYPQIDPEKCVKCGLCQKVCHYQKQAASCHDDPLAVYAAVNKEKKVLKRSASGGIFAALARGVLEDGGLVFGAAFTRGYGVKHIAVEKEEDLRYLQGSKYTQSEVGRSYQAVKKILASGRKVLFSGTPCQVDGLYGYLGGDDDKLCTVDLICHGVPNNRMLKDYLKMLGEKHGGEVKNFVFRDKNIGWGINGSAMIAGKKRKIWQSASSYLYYFTKGLLYRENCYQCPYACSKRCGDITLGDFWGIEKQHPEYLGKNGLEEGDGISLILANTVKGVELLDAQEDRMIRKESQLDKAAAGNPQLNHPCDKGIRDEIVSIYQEGGWKALEERYRKRIGWRYYSSQGKALIPKKLKRALKARR